MLALAAGASVGVGAMSVPVLGAALSQPITGSVVPTRITDLASYLVGGGKGLGRGRGLDDGSFSGEDDASQTSFGSVNGPSTPTAHASPTVNVPRVTSQIPTPTSATNDQKRMLAVASFGGGLVIAFISFVLVRRVIGG